MIYQSTLYIFILLFSFFQTGYSENYPFIPKEHSTMIDRHPHTILGVGSACIDLLIPVSEEFLKTHVPGVKGGAQKISIANLEHIVQESHIKPEIATGGSCANTIKGLANLGQSCALVAKIGQDKLGAHFESYIKQCGVLPLFFKAQASTPCVLCLITPDGQRTMRFFEGCSQEMTKDILFPKYFESVRLVHIEGYALRNEGLVERIVSMAKEAHALISFDVSSFEIVSEYREKILDLLTTSVDIVFANEDETRMLTGLDPLEGCQKLKTLCPIAVVLAGQEGCLVGSEDQVFKSPAFPAKVVDTTGAGDLFASGFLYSFLKGDSLQTCAKAGNLVGSCIIEVTGAELSPEKWDYLKQTIHLLDELE